MIHEGQDGALLGKHNSEATAFEVFDDHGEREDDRKPTMRRFILPILLTVSVFLNLLLLGRSTSNPAEASKPAATAASIEREKTRYGESYAEPGQHQS
jgi:hypothetical protein